MSFVDQVNSLSKENPYFILKDEIITNLVKQLDLEAVQKNLLMQMQILFSMVTKMIENVCNYHGNVYRICKV